MTSTHKKTHVQSGRRGLKKKHSVYVFLGFITPFFLTMSVFISSLIFQGSIPGEVRSTSDLEVGVTDLSPRGVSGGAYIPASCVLGPGLSGGHEICTPTLTVNPATVTIPLGGYATYAYTSTQAYSCDRVVTGLASGVGNFSYGTPSGTFTNIGPYGTAGTQLVTMTCWDEPRVQSVSKTVTITVSPDVFVRTSVVGGEYPWAKIYSFSSNLAVVPAWGNVTLSWSGAGSCVGSGGIDWAGAKADSGSEVISNPTPDASWTLSNYTFKITCTTPEGSASKSIQIAFTNTYVPYQYLSCFVEDTRVTLSDGSTKYIRDIVVGDRLLGEAGSVNTVIGIEQPSLGDRLLYAINGGEPFVTSEHPFMTTDGWKSIDPSATREENAELTAGKLVVGDTLVTEHGNILITSIVGHNGNPEQTLYNLLLDGGHTYYANGFLVHNKTPEP
jgi:hypothetical protein